MSALPDGQAALRLYEQALAPFLQDAARLRPAAGEVIDAHTHLGLDEDGRSLDLEGLISMLDAAQARRACVFPLHDPERRPSYSLPNDRVLRWAGESEGRLVPFCRLDPAEDPLTEGARCIEAGARGIKLHPRAQAFDFSGAQMQGIFALAEEAGVPILIHAGRGLPPLAEALVDLALKHPGATLILAHGAICDQGIITARLADHPAVLYDTSCFFPVDVIELLARVPAERVVFASDPPYGATAPGLYLALRVAAQAGLEEQALRGVLGETMAALIDGDELPAPTERRRPGAIALSGRLARIYGYASLAGPALFGGSAEQALAMIEMALAACRLPDGAAEQAPDHERVALSVIHPALEATNVLLSGSDGSQTRVRATMDLLFRTIALAATAVPDAEAVQALQSIGTGQLSA
ncbi:MAG TPA: amidohydrolase family protein [Solirubrobacteraceae bacterium]|jgi:predicted TIM-barrel fold metal-dependent hydrolase|nr:amidohydrolase family protein [Solirubrobacteraceae bacterium]